MIICGESDWKAIFTACMYSPYTVYAIMAAEAMLKNQNFYMFVAP